MTAKYVPIEALSKHLSISVSTLRGWVRRDKIPISAYIRVGNTYRFCIEDVIAALRQGGEEEEAKPEAAPAQDAFDTNLDTDY